MLVNRKNFSSSTLQSAVGSGDTTIILQTGSGANFPTATTGLSYFWATIRTADYSKKEVVKVVNTSGDVFTVERAQQNTLANTFSASDIVEHTITANEMPNQEVNTNSTPTFDSLKLSPTPTNSEPLSEGHLRYDATERTLSLGVGYGSVLQIGQEQYIRVRNNTGGTIANGKVVYISGSLGNRPTVALAKADLIATSEATIGMATADILNNADGFITISGVVHDLDTSAYDEGDPLYLSDTVFGGLTTTKPIGAYVVKIGLVTRSHAVQGEILVTVDNNTVAKQLTDELETRLVQLTDELENRVVTGTTNAGSVALAPTKNIVGDFTNATVESRSYAQTSVTNGFTAFSIKPNGTSVASWQLCLNNSVPTNSAYGGTGINANEVQLISGKYGTGTVLPIKAIVNGIVLQQWNTDGSLSFIYGGASGKNYGTYSQAITEFRPWNTVPGLNQMVLAANSYYNGTNTKAYQTGAAAYYYINAGANGSHVWYSAASVAADANQTMATQMVLDISGNLTATGNVTAYSDIRLKKDLNKITDALNKVKQLSGYTYTRIDNEERNVGLIAQDVQKVLPEAVREGQDGKLSVAYGNMVAILVEAIKELDEKIESIKTKVY